MLLRKNYNQIQTPVGPYVHATIHNSVFYSSGMSAYGTPADNGNIAEQTQEIFRQLSLMLQEEHSGLNNLIKVTLFVTSLSEISELRTILFEIYGEHIPSSSIIEVKSLFASTIKIEIEAIAALNNDN